MDSGNIQCIEWLVSELFHAVSYIYLCSYTPFPLFLNHLPHFSPSPWTTFHIILNLLPHFLNDLPQIRNDPPHSLNDFPLLDNILSYRYKILLVFICSIFHLSRFIPMCITQDELLSTLLPFNDLPHLLNLFPQFLFELLSTISSFPFIPKS